MLINLSTAPQPLRIQFMATLDSLVSSEDQLHVWFPLPLFAVQLHLSVPLNMLFPLLGTFFSSWNTANSPPPPCFPWLISTSSFRSWLRITMSVPVSFHQHTVLNSHSTYSFIHFINIYWVLLTCRHCFRLIYHTGVSLPMLIPHIYICVCVLLHCNSQIVKLTFLSVQFSAFFLYMHKVIQPSPLSNSRTFSSPQKETQ